MLTLSSMHWLIIQVNKDLEKYFSLCAISLLSKWKHKPLKVTLYKFRANNNCDLYQAYWHTIYTSFQHFLLVVFTHHLQYNAMISNVNYPEMDGFFEQSLHFQTKWRTWESAVGQLKIPLINNMKDYPPFNLITTTKITGTCAFSLFSVVSLRWTTLSTAQTESLWPSHDFLLALGIGMWYFMLRKLSWVSGSKIIINLNDQRRKSLLPSHPSST